MKQFFFLFAVLISVAACQEADKKAAPGMSLEEREKALKDSSNFTTITWADAPENFNADSNAKRAPYEQEVAFIDLGKVKKGRKLEIPFYFTNSGTKNLVIQNAQPGCGCTIAEKPEQPIAPGKQGVIKAIYDTKDQGLGEHRKNVVVTANTLPANSHTLNFRVEVVE